MAVHLSYGAWEAGLAPELGGAVLWLRCGGLDVLRPASEGLGDVLSSACFALLPYVNRIAAGQFFWEGRLHHIRPYAPDPRSSLHGLGWQRAWVVDAQAAHTAILSLDHLGDEDWPWPFHAEQHFQLEAQGLVSTVALTNLAQQVVPVGLGFHPYFLASAETRLTTRVSGAWGADAAVLPTTPLPPDAFGHWDIGDFVQRETLVDHAFSGWSGEAVIDQPDLRIRMSSPEAKFFHLYLPTDQGYFCAEPVTHLPNALNRPDMPPMATLMPGETARLTMRINAEKI